ncbi:putative ribonuclease h protein, partial [Nicotiana attenuata]
NIFFECSASRPLWAHLGLLHHINTLQHLTTSLIERIKLLIKNYNHHIPYNIPPSTLITFCLWGIWIQRNQNLFHQQSTPVPYLQITKKAVKFHFLTSRPHKNTQPTPLYIKWKPPNHNHYKLNTDGETKSPRLNGIGGVIRSSDENWILGYSKHIEFGTSIQMELTALLYGLRLSLQHGYFPLEINIDAKEINDCRLLLRQLGDPLLQHTYREANMVADGLAKYGTQLSCSSGLKLFDTPPPFAYQDFHSDKVGTAKRRFVNSCI